MLTLHQDRGFDPTGRRATPATWCRVTLGRGHDGLETRAFLRHEAILYPWPLRDWSDGDAIDFFLEAPGRYTLIVEWRDPRSRDGGREHLEFAVSPAVSSRQPTRTRARGGRYWAPNAYEAAMIKRHESRMILDLERLVPRGGVVYDIGANIGLWSVPAAQAVGPGGQVVCIEPSPLCIPYLVANLEAADITWATVLPLAVSDGAPRIDLRLSYGNSHLSTGGPSGLGLGKPGHVVTVPASSLDGIVESYGLPDPDLLKIDVEGIEAWILPGCGALLERARPLVVLEVHGVDQARVVGPALEYVGYRLEDAESGERFESAKDFARRFGPGVRQLLARWEGASVEDTPAAPVSVSSTASGPGSSAR
ncbi:MAG: FkbM family methyltransferase [Acidobacteriota bacterium]